MHPLLELPGDVLIAQAACKTSALPVCAQERHTVPTVVQMLFQYQRGGRIECTGHVIDQQGGDLVACNGGSCGLCHASPTPFFRWVSAPGQPLTARGGTAVRDADAL